MEELVSKLGMIPWDVSVHLNTQEAFVNLRTRAILIRVEIREYARQRKVNTLALVAKICTRAEIVKLI